MYLEKILEKFKIYENEKYSIMVKKKKKNEKLKKKKISIQNYICMPWKTCYIFISCNED